LNFKTLIGFILAAGIASFGQTSTPLTASAEKLRIKRGETGTARVHAQLKAGYHANSDKPAEDYLIPLKLTWSAAPLEASGVTYPTPKMEKYEFSEKPLSVVSGDFEILTKFKAPPNAPNGPAIITGKLRYQACTDRMCLPPKTVEVPLTVDIQ
jgi:hypothetical protein